MAGSELIAIITRTKNRPLFLRRAIQSVQAQTYTNYLHIIINDGGDQSEIVSLLTEILGENVWASHCIVSTIDSNNHMEAATNAGLAVAREREAEYIVIHDDDDTWSPEFLSVMIRELHKYEELVPTVRGVVCRSNQVHERIEGNIITVDHLEAHAPHIPELGLLKLADLLNSDYNFGVNQFLYRLNALVAVGDYDQLFPVLGDWDFNLRFLQHYDIALIPNFLAFYHRRIGVSGPNANSGSGDVPRRVQWEAYQQLIYNRYLREGSAVGVLMNFPTAKILSQLQDIQDQLTNLRKGL